MRNPLNLRRLSAFVGAGVVAASVLVAPAPHSTAAPAWVSVEAATVHPGVMTFTNGAQCTSNFVFHDATAVYIGQAAHCAGTGPATDTNGCTAATLPLGTPVEIDGASAPGRLVYSSWIAMQERGETDQNWCLYNDFALVRLDPADHDTVNPTVPFWGGPTGLASSASTLSRVYTYGNSSLRLGLSDLSPKTGAVVSQLGGGRGFTVYTVTPGIPGDSGSAFMSANGGALGVLSTVALLPLPASNNVSGLARALEYMRANSSLTGVQLATGTEPFSPIV